MRQVFSVLVCLVAGSALATDPSRLSLGKISASVVPEQHAKKVHLEAVIDASPDRVWGIVTDCANFKRTMPRTVASRELSRDGDVVVCQSTLDLAAAGPRRDHARGSHHGCRSLEIGVDAGFRGLQRESRELGPDSVRCVPVFR